MSQERKLEEEVLKIPYSRVSSENKSEGEVLKMPLGNVSSENESEEELLKMPLSNVSSESRSGTVPGWQTGIVSFNEVPFLLKDERRREGLTVHLGTVSGVEISFWCEGKDGEDISSVSVDLSKLSNLRSMILEWSLAGLLLDLWVCLFVDETLEHVDRFSV